jgi:ABC-type sugar transport system permease subunit
VWSFRVFDIVFGLTKGGPGLATEVLSIHIYRTSFVNLQMGYGNAQAFVMLIIMLGLCGGLIMRLTRELAAQGG